jgi:hypothetical protein
MQDPRAGVGSKTWTGGDAGLTHAEMFIGTWARSGTQTVTTEAGIAQTR